MIETFHDPREAAEWCAGTRRKGHTLGFVPTMGALHEGHLGLVRRAARENGRACVSVFVNPLQFDDARDFERYPRNFTADAAELEGAGCAMVFTGTLEGFFPGELDSEGNLPAERLLDPGPSAAGLEGRFRPGHFAGVATIVDRLFELVRPARAYFGQKDFQQCLVVGDLMPRHPATQLVVCPTVREDSGVAMSSRNLLLEDEGQRAAPTIARALDAAQRVWDGGERDPDALCDALQRELGASTLEVEYAEVRDPAAWTAERPPGPLERAVALIAACAGAVRLIDNRLLSASP